MEIPGKKAVVHPTAPRPKLAAGPGAGFHESETAGWLLPLMCWRFQNGPKTFRSRWTA